MEQIFYNGRVITMESASAEEEKTKEPEAVLVRDGIIVGIGKLADVMKISSNKAQKRDLEGKCLMPSFIDSHSHIVMNGQMALLADLSQCESFDDIIVALKDYIEKNHITKDDVVLAFGYDHNFLKEGMQPDKRVLDKVSSEIPILILHVSAHLACANSPALKLAGINADTPNPEGGIIGRLEIGNEPSGYVEEAGMNLLQHAIISRVKTDFSLMIQKMQDIYIENGVTTVQDGATREDEINILLKLSELGNLKIDVISYLLMPSDGMSLMQKYGKRYNNYNGRFKIGGYKLVLDGSPQGRSAWMSEPYLEGDDNYCGYPWMMDEAVEHYVEQAVIEQKQILVHCNGDAASEQFLNAYEKAVSEIGSEVDLRPVMIHCQTVRNDQLERMVKLDMIASIFVGHVWYWGDVHVKNFGPKRGNHISPVKDAIDRGVLVNFHQDTPVTRPDMLHSIWCAVNRVSRGGNIIGEEQAVAVYDAIKAVTINAAYQYSEEKSKGSIAIGKRADLVILDNSPLEVDKMDIKNIRVLETIKDGVTIYRADSDC